MTIGEIIEQKRRAGIKVDIKKFTTKVETPLWLSQRSRGIWSVFGRRPREKYTVVKLFWEWYSVIEDGVETLRVGMHNMESRWYVNGALASQKVPYDSSVEQMFIELRDLYEAPEKAAAKRAKEEEAQTIKEQKCRVYSCLLKNGLSAKEFSLGQILDTKKRNGSQIDICNKVGDGAMLWRIMENGAPILKVIGYWSNDDSYQYRDKDWFDDAKVFLYVNGKPYKPDPEIYVETCESILTDVFALYNAQEEEKKTEVKKAAAERLRERTDGFYNQWCGGLKQEKSRTV